MGNFKRNYNRFIYQNRNRGIPNLMLWICISNAAIYLLSWMYPSLQSLLNFDMKAIAQGQVWRLVTYPLVYVFDYGNILGVLLGLLLYYWIGNVLEHSWGTLKLNLFYFTAMLLMDLAAVLCYALGDITVLVSGTYINNSLFLAVATLIPEQQILLFYLIPVKMRWAALLNIVLTFLPIYALVTTGSVLGNAWILALSCGLSPAIALLNYFLFFGRDVRNLFPSRPGRGHRTKAWQRMASEPQPNPDWAKNYRSANGERPYRHKCTVCGRTDTDCPGLEFRYCSKCKGYFCYCIDHINNHTHVQ